MQHLSILKINNVIESKSIIDDTLPLYRGAQLLTTFQYIDMTQQVRAKGDKDQMKLIQNPKR